MKFLSALLLCAAIAFMPAQAQSKRSKSRAAKPAAAAPAAAPAAAAAPKAEEVPQNGIRFVVCSPSGLSIPSPLYVQDGKEFKALVLGSRTPSQRMRPVGNTINFWDEDPSKIKADEATGKKPEMPEPVFSIKVPTGLGSKTVCLLSPNKDLKKTAALFLNEKDFPRKGMHLINLSSFPLILAISESPDFKDKKESKIGVYRREDGICENNSWSFKGKQGQVVSFILSYQDKGSKLPKRIKASSFVISERQAVINLVLKDATRNVPKLMTIQLAEKPELEK